MMKIKLFSSTCLFHFRRHRRKEHKTWTRIFRRGKRNALSATVKSASQHSTCTRLLRINSRRHILSDEVLAVLSVRPTLN